MDKQILHIAALNVFEGKLREEAAILEETFAILDVCVDKLELVNAPLSWITAHTLSKTGSTSLMLYKMILDGRLSERRELINFVIESLELLIYIGNRSHRYDKSLPTKSSAVGETANANKGRNTLLWEGLNTRASQLGLSHESLRPIIHFDCEHWGNDQPRDIENLKAKLEKFNRVLIRLALEGVNCLGLVSCSEESIFFERFHVHIEQSHKVFGSPEEGSNLLAENVA